MIFLMNDSKFYEMNRQVRQARQGREEFELLSNQCIVNENWYYGYKTL
jgi:hypothetical protein